MFIDNIHIIWTTYIASAVDELTAHFDKQALNHLESTTIACYEGGNKRPPIHATTI